MKYLIIILMLFSSCSHSNFKYNRAVAERNRITDAIVGTVPYKNKTSVWDYLAASGLFVGLVIIINNQPQKK